MSYKSEFGLFMVKYTVKILNIRKTTQEGQRFGEGKKSSECIKASLNRVKIVKISLPRRGSLFFSEFRSWYSSACYKVPSRSPLSVKDVYWWRKEVKMRSRNSFACFRLMENIQVYCHPNIKKKKYFKARKVIKKSKEVKPINCVLLTFSKLSS